MLRSLITFVLGLYLTVAIVVGGCGAYHFMFGHPSLPKCVAPGGLKTTAANIDDGSLAGGPNWVPWVLYRAVAWPKAYYDDMNKVGGVVEWLMVEYDPFSGRC